MRLTLTNHGFKVWISARETEEWATKPGASWPCSTLRGHRIFAEFDRGGLVDFALDGSSDKDCDGHEFNALVSDFVRGKVPQDCAAYVYVAD